MSEQITTTLRPVKIERTECGRYYLWECGGVMKDNRIMSTIISTKDIKPKKPLFARVSETRDNNKYAKIPLNLGDIIVQLNSSMDFKPTIKIFKIKRFSKISIGSGWEYYNVADCELLDEYSHCKWKSGEHKKYSKLVKLALFQATANSKDALFIDDKQ